MYDVKDWGCFREGFEASKKHDSNSGAKGAQNPYPKGSIKYYSWNQGWGSHYDKSWDKPKRTSQSMDKEELREYRYQKARKRADRLEEWADKKLKKAKQIEDSWPDCIHDIAFCTQPGHIPMRARINRQQEKVFQLREEAKKLQERAEGVMEYKTRVAGDAEAMRELQRKEQDAIIGVGTKIYAILYGRKGIVEKVFKKSYRIRFADINHPVTMDKTFVKKI